jgi:hypothetical protein
MPLADGIGNAPPDSHEWKPASLWHRMEQRKAQGAWFTEDEIVAVMDSVLQGRRIGIAIDRSRTKTGCFCLMELKSFTSGDAWLGRFVGVKTKNIRFFA